MIKRHNDQYNTPQNVDRFDTITFDVGECRNLPGLFFELIMDSFL